jgi:hypothetical protein
MTKDLGVWKAEDCALVLIDYQTEMFEVIRSETNADLVELHARLLARTAKAFDMPIVLSTVGVTRVFHGCSIAVARRFRRRGAPVRAVALRRGTRALRCPPAHLTRSCRL